MSGRYDILSDPVKIGPVTAPNRFYQTPHATGMGYSWPRHTIAHRRVRAEGGWGVVSTEECMIHPSSDHMSAPHMRLWSDEDIPFLAAIADAVHAHGSLFAVELAHAGRAAANRLTRDQPLAPSLLPYPGYGPYVARPMDLADIREFRSWHRAAALRAKQAGADIVYVYCAHDLSLPMQFLLPRYNQRTDAYGGPLENRIRLLRELLEDTKDAVGDTCAIALRFAVDELIGDTGMEHDGEAPEIVDRLADLPDLWDVNISDWTNDSGVSRFFDEGWQEPFTAFVKQVTGKPVIGVGRYTSPDRMVSLIQKGHLDLIGAARPGIADPFLPKKIMEGRIEDIRECIGCNICTTNVLLGAPIRCTQNPTIGQEWSRGWHPENTPKAQTPETVLVLGAGPAGLECALTLARRGHDVMLAEAEAETGGRSRRESRLTGLQAWSRVADYRDYQLSQMPNVQVFRGNRLSGSEIMDLGIPHVVLAEGADWRADGVGRVHLSPVDGWESAEVLTPDDLMNGTEVSGDVVVFDDEHYYMGSVVAEHLARTGAQVTLVTTAAEVGTWSKFSLEFPHIQSRLAELRIEIVPLHKLKKIGPDSIELAHVFSGDGRRIEGARLLMVTSKAPNTTVHAELTASAEALADAGITTLGRIGDGICPGPIAQAVHDGHLWAMNFGEHAPVQKIQPIAPFRA